MFNRFNYLGQRTNILFIILFFLGFYWGGMFIFLLSLPCILIWFAARKNNGQGSAKERNDADIYLSPISGRIKGIERLQTGEIIVKICSSFFSGWSLLLPFRAEMMALKRQEGELPLDFETLHMLSPSERESLSKTTLFMDSSHGRSYQIECFYPVEERAPKIWMKSGDLGQASASFGYIPQGGWAFCYLPKGTDILFVIDEYVSAGDSVLGVVKVENKDNLQRIDHGL